METVQYVITLLADLTDDENMTKLLVLAAQE